MNVYPIVNKEKILCNLNVRIEQFKAIQKAKIKRLLVLKKYLRACEEYNVFFPNQDEHITIRKILKELKDLRHSIV
jgi:hypothetical protein